MADSYRIESDGLPSFQKSTIRPSEWTTYCMISGEEGGEGSLTGVSRALETLRLLIPKMV